METEIIQTDSVFVDNSATIQTPPELDELIPEDNK